MTLPRLDAINEHWEKVPPLSHSVASIASFLGVGKKSAAPRKMPKAVDEPSVSDVQGLLDLLGANGFATEKPTWLKEVATT